MNNSIRALSFAALAATFLAALSLGPAVAQGQGQATGKPSFAGKPEEKMGKGGRSAEAKEHAESKKKLMMEEAERAKAAKDKKAKGKN